VNEIAQKVPVAEGLFTFPSDEPQLIGSRCTGCGITTFPVQGSCPRCASTAMEEHLLYGAPGTAGVSILTLR